MMRAAARNMTAEMRAADHAAYVAAVRAQVAHATPATLDLTSKLLTGAEVAQILGAVEAPEAVTTLVLAHNPIGAGGAKAVGEFLAKSPSLTALDLRCTRIGNEGLKSILEGLSTNISLTSLDLRRNEFGDESAQGIAAFLRGSVTIAAIDLRHNRISENGVGTITEVVSSCGATADIWVSDSQAALSAALEQNRNRPMVLTLHWQPPVAGALRLVCLTMAGRELASVDAHTSDTLGALRQKVAQQVSVNASNVVLILPDATILEDASGSLKKLLAL